MRHRIEKKADLSGRHPSTVAPGGVAPCSGAGANTWRLGGNPGSCVVERDVSDQPIFTIGHSTRSLGEFVDLLHVGGADLVVDVRTVPRSRHNPQYNEDVLPDELAIYEIGYQRMRDLGGLRGRAREVPAETNGFWKNQSFHNYADYALSNQFAAALERLLELGVQRRCAVMCAEAVWWRCHRRIIADYLLVRGRTVLHLMGLDRVAPARLTPAAHAEDGKITYPRDQ